MDVRALGADFVYVRCFGPWEGVTIYTRLIGIGERKYCGNCNQYYTPPNIIHQHLPTRKPDLSCICNESGLVPFPSMPFEGTSQIVGGCQRAAASFGGAENSSVLYNTEERNMFIVLLGRSSAFVHLFEFKHPINTKRSEYGVPVPRFIHKDFGKINTSVIHGTPAALDIRQPSPSLLALLLRSGLRCMLCAERPWSSLHLYLLLRGLFFRQSTSSIEPLFHEPLTIFIQKLVVSAKENIKVNLCDAISCLAVDVVRLFSFGGSAGCLQPKNFDASAFVAVDGLLEGSYIVG
ncbi:hypothetical protein NEOLEDRAFT_1150818 [Neolentinus lepideus HHB14362 ss-1]|uniref:Uncharacterized protein n=1 Tax=Neolentinus lepideus HHB14362 ss-1 TaxID=1314782 RepID=A0A165PMQ2_9AGAM|nr:hypothetical protein NEOLEDRAFT_1150818 [Neolentinus lepideus HHB14362 ss-1]